jgi:hypothetical protein
MKRGHRGPAHRSGLVENQSVVFGWHDGHTIASYMLHIISQLVRTRITPFKKSSTTKALLEVFHSITVETRTWQEAFCDHLSDPFVPLRHTQTT